MHNTRSINLKIKKEIIGLHSFECILNEFNKIEKEDPNTIETVTVDLSEVKEIHNLPTVMLWVLMKKYRKYNYKKNVILGNNIDKILGEKNFFNQIMDVATNSATLPINFETFNIQDAANSNSKITEIIEKTIGRFLNKKNEFHSEIKVNIKELINNAYDHSAAEKDIACLCGINKKSGRLEFCIADSGVGFKQGFITNPQLKKDYKDLDDVSIIEIATQKSKSCNPRHAPHPDYSYTNGGIGLFYLRKFIELHPNGDLIIISGKGLLNIKNNGIIKKRSISTSWQGTLIYFTIPIDINKSNEYQELCDEFEDGVNKISINGN